MEDNKTSFRIGRTDSPPVRSKDIAAEIVRAIGNGTLKPGVRLPTQRDLASEFNVSLGTVTRAYKELAKRGLLSGEVGRGSYVSRLAEPGPALGGLADARFVDLTINRPPSHGCCTALAESLATLAKWGDLGELLSHQPSRGRLKYREAALKFLAQIGIQADVDRVVVTNGVQHGLAAILGAVAQPGDVILTEGLSFPGVRLLEAIFHVRLVGLELDSEGVCPDSLERFCRAKKARFLLLNPSVQNPTAAVMLEERRRMIAAIAERYNLCVVENDIYGALLNEKLPAISSLIPERSFYVTGTSKCLGAGVRLGYIVFPRGMSESIAASAQATNWMASPLNCEIVTGWINDGTTLRIIDWHRQEAAKLQNIAADALRDVEFKSYPTAYHVWVHLPDYWRTKSFVEALEDKGVAVSPADQFSIGPMPAPNAVRVSLAGAADHSQLNWALKVVSETWHHRP